MYSTYFTVCECDPAQVLLSDYEQHKSNIMTIGSITGYVLNLFYYGMCNNGNYLMRTPKLMCIPFLKHLQTISK